MNPMSMKEGLMQFFTSNKLVRNFIISDLMLFGGWGLIAPVMSIFVLNEIEGATLVTVGSLAAIYWAVRSAVELPMAVFIEKTEGEKDDMYVLISGLLLISSSAFIFNFVETIPQLFACQAVHALGFAFYAASWSGIFSRHIEKSKAAFSWSLDHTFLGIATGIAGIVGGYFAEEIGFNAIFGIVGLMSLAAAAIVFIVPDIIFPFPKRKASAEEAPDHSPKIIR